MDVVREAHIGNRSRQIQQQILRRRRVGADAGKVRDSSDLSAAGANRDGRKYDPVRIIRSIEAARGSEPSLKTRFKSVFAFGPAHGVAVCVQGARLSAGSRSAAIHEKVI